MASTSGAFWNKELFGGSLTPLVARFWTWWRAEFLAFFPPATRAWLLDRGDRKFVLRAGDGPKQLVPASAGPQDMAQPIRPDELRAVSLGEALSRRGLRRDATSVILEIQRSAFFIRRFDIPASAQSNLPRLLANELERKTPFRPEQVLFGHVARPHPGSAEKLQVEQWILRRDIIERALDGSELGMDDIDIIQPEGGAGDRGDTPAIPLRDAKADDASAWFRNIVIGLCGAAAVFVAAGVAITIWRQEQLNGELEAKVADLSARAAKVRQLADRATGESQLLATLRQERGKYPLLGDLWEELSRILPDGAYVTEARLSEGRGGERIVDIIGLADSAVGLPALFDKSPVFSDASLTSAITPDVQQKKEGYSLQAKVKQTNAAKAK